MNCGADQILGIEEKNSMWNKHKNGFTLIEILVSLVVFGLVMASAAGGLYYLYKDWQKQRNYLQSIENARWAMEFIGNEVKQGGNVGSGVVGGVQETLHFEIDTNGDNTPDTRVWYWLGTTVGIWDYGEPNTLYRGVDNPPMNAVLVQSLQDEARLNRQELANLIWDSSGPNDIFDMTGGVFDIELIVRPDPAQLEGTGNRNYTLRTQVRARN